MPFWAARHSQHSHRDPTLLVFGVEHRCGPDDKEKTGQGNLVPSCVRQHPDGTKAEAYPPRRIVELAQAFGENGSVQSICQDDFTSAFDVFFDRMAKPLSEMCMTQQLSRRDDGTVACSMYWTLPTAATKPAQDTPVTCPELDELFEPGPNADRTTPDGSHICQIRQLGVNKDSVEAGPGWYYDDLTEGLDKLCAGEDATRSRRIAFSPGVRAPEGVSVKVECN